MYLSVNTIVTYLPVGSLQEAGVIRAAHNLNTPITVVVQKSAINPGSLFIIDQPAVVIDTVKVCY